MKAGDARKIKVEAGAYRELQIRLRQEAERKALEINKNAELQKIYDAAQRSKLIGNYEEKISLVATDLTLVRKRIVEAVAEGKNYIFLDADFFKILKNHLHEVGLVGFPLGLSQITLPPILLPFESSKGHGVLDPAIVLQRYSENFDEIRLELIAERDADEKLMFQAEIYEVLSSFDSDDWPKLDYVDIQILEDLQNKIIKGRGLTSDELAVVSSIFGGNLHLLSLASTHAEKRKTAHYSKLGDDVANMRKKINFFDAIATKGKLILCWGGDFWRLQIFDDKSYTQNPIFHWYYDTEDIDSIDFLKNIKLLNWLDELYFQDFFSFCENFISTCASNELESCTINVVKEGLIFSAGSHREGYSFSSPTPLQNKNQAQQFWALFFSLFEYKVNSIERKNIIEVSWV
jgi:hypothetical protein